MGPRSLHVLGHAVVGVCHLDVLSARPSTRLSSYGVHGELYVDVILSRWFYGKASKWCTPPAVT